MNLQSTELTDVKELHPKVFGDRRGYVFESYREEYTDLGLTKMVQVNISRSTRGVLRGLHFQSQQPQAKLISVIRGEVFDVAVDIRVGSPTFGQWISRTLSEENHVQLFIPVGFAHGFCVLSDEVDFLYQCSDYYHPQSEVGIQWNDPEIGIAWPEKNPILSDKDAKNQPLRTVPQDLLPRFIDL